MEASHPLAIESFSYSWLLNARRPSLDGLADSESHIHEDDITFAVHSMRFLEADEAKNFKFDITADSECALVHADEIFSDGHIMPLYLDRPKAEEAMKQAFNSSSSSVSAPATPANFSLSVRGKKDRDYIIQKWKKLRSRILQKWFGFLRPLCKRLGSSRKSTAKVDDLNRKAREVQSWSNSLQASPRRICKASSDVDWAGDLRKTKSCSNTPQESPLHSPYHSTDVWCNMAQSDV